MILGLAGTHPFYKEKYLINTEGFLQAPTPQQQIQSFTDEGTSREIILRTIETNNSGSYVQTPTDK